MSKLREPSTAREGSAIAHDLVDVKATACKNVNSGPAEWIESKFVACESLLGKANCRRVFSIAFEV